MAKLIESSVSRGYVFQMEMMARASVMGYKIGEVIDLICLIISMFFDRLESHLLIVFMANRNSVARKLGSMCLASCVCSLPSDCNDVSFVIYNLMRIL